MKRRLTIVITLCFALVSGLFIQACAKKQVGTSGPDIDGTYSLVSVDGRDVPASVSHGGVALQVLSGTFIINADGTCSSKTVFVPPQGAAVEREVDATYTREGSSLTMQWKGAGITVGTVEGSTFTMDNEGLVFVYGK